MEFSDGRQIRRLGLSFMRSVHPSASSKAADAESQEKCNGYKQRSTSHLAPLDAFICHDERAIVKYLAGSSRLEVNSWEVLSGNRKSQVLGQAGCQWC